MIAINGMTAEEVGAKNADILSRTDLRFYDIKQEPFRIYGLLDPLNNHSPYRRLPQDVADATNEGVKHLCRQTAGGRVRFTTTSDYIAIKMTSGGCAKMTNMSLIGSSGFDLYMKRNGVEIFRGVFNPPYGYGPEGYDSILPLPKGRKELTINFPLYSGVDELYIGLDMNSELSRHPDYKVENPVLYYGSSITQGCDASHPGMAYEAIISRRLDANYINLGFSGSARAEQAMIDYLAGIECSVFVQDYDHNAPTTEHLANTHEKLYKAFRATHPDTPVVFTTKPDFWLDHIDHLERREVIFHTYENARKRGEKVLFVDGWAIFPQRMREDCTIDGCHPNDIGMMGMADAIGSAVEYALSM